MNVRGIVAEALESKSPERYVTQYVESLDRGALVWLATHFLLKTMRASVRSQTLAIEKSTVRPATDQISSQTRKRRARKSIAEALERSRRTGTPVENLLTPEERSRYELDRQMEQDMIQIEKGLVQNISTALEVYREEVIQEWTEELLSSPLSLPDGTQTTWGAATLDQHQQRAEMFTRNAVANVEGAARHKKAIVDLENAGVETLAELIQNRNPS